VLYSFKGGKQAKHPRFPDLISDTQGNLYGTAEFGTRTGCDTTYGCGTVFRLTPQGKRTVLNAFLGGEPSAVIMDARGSLYGTTFYDGPSGYGTVFEVSPQGKKTVLYSFSGGRHGAFPQAGLVADAQGNLYGTTSEGGRRCVTAGCGTVFEVTPQGAETVLYAFKGRSDGAVPYARLIWDVQRNLYGTTSGGGGNSSGTVFEVTPQGTETVLYAFQGKSDGAVPYAGLIWDAQGNLYGTTSEGGNSGCNGYGCGTVFELIKSTKK